MFVPDLLFLELFFEFFLIDLLEHVLEPAVIGLQDRVFGRQVNRPAKVQAIVQGCAGKVIDRLVEVIHAHGDAGIRGVENLFLDHGAVGAFEFHRQLARAGKQKVGGAVLITECMPADDDRFCPARHQPRHVGTDDRLAENHTAKDVADGAIGRTIHPLQAEFLDPVFVRGNGGAFDADTVFLDRLGRVDGDLVVGAVALFDPEIIILQVDIEIGQDQLVLDELPDNAGHLIAVELDDRVFYLDLRHMRPSFGMNFWIRARHRG